MNPTKSAEISRPFGIIALSIFFFAATGITCVAAISLLFPNRLLEPIWKLNPRARIGLGDIGIWAPLLFFVVALACAAAAIGLWRGARWGYVMAITILTINSFANLFNVISGKEPRAIIGIPIVILLLAYLFSQKVRQFFWSSTERTLPCMQCLICVSLRDVCGSGFQMLVVDRRSFHRLFCGN